MAKEQWHSWSRTIITIISLAFVCGITYNSIGGNTDDINKVDNRVTVEIKEVDDRVGATSQEHAQDIKKIEDRILTTEQDIHTIQLDSKDIKNLAITTAKTMQSIDSKLDAIQEKQAEQSTIQAVMSVKLETLTKDE